MPKADELVNVKLVVGKQHIVLKPLWGCACVVAQAVQRVVNARCRKQRQRKRATGLGLPGAVGNTIVHGCQIGQIKHLAHHLSALGAEAALDVVVVSKREMNRDGLCAQAHFKLHGMVALK